MQNSDVNALKMSQSIRNSTLSIAHSMLGLEDAFNKSASLSMLSQISSDTHRERIIQYGKLAISVGFLAIVLGVLSGQVFVQSMRGISVSSRLTSYLILGNFIDALQDEREMSCLYLSTSE